MSRGSSLTVLAVLAASGALIAGCTSSGSSSSSTPTASPTSVAASVSTPATSAPAPAPASSTAAGSAATTSPDCVTIQKISSGVVAVLYPLQTESTAKADAALKGYVSLLTTQAATLTTPAGKAALGSFISALKKAMTEPKSQATATVTTAIANLNSACA